MAVGAVERKVVDVLGMRDLGNCTAPLFLSILVSALILKILALKNGNSRTSSLPSIDSSREDAGTLQCYVLKIPSKAFLRHSAVKSFQDSDKSLRRSYYQSNELLFAKEEVFLWQQ